MTSIRPFLLEDLFRVHKVNIDEMTETYNTAFYSTYLEKWPEYCKLVENSRGATVAYVLGKSEGRMDKEEWHGHVSAVTVAPGSRRLGLASMLMADLESTSEDQGCFFVDLFVRASNTTAIRFYKRLGYVIYRRVLAYYGDNDEDAFDMRKALSRDKTRASMIPRTHPVHPSDIKWT